MNPFAPELEAARMVSTAPKDSDASAGPQQQTPAPPPQEGPAADPHQTPVPHPQETRASSPAPAAPPGSTPPDRFGEAVAAGRAAGRWLAQPRPRTALVGVALLLTGAVIADSSVWTLPLVIIGVVMIVVAWIGRRLGGHIGVTWGEHGAEIAVRARVSPASVPDATARPAIAQDAPAAEARADADDVIEGQAHTVEIDVEELKALIAAAEAADQPQTPTVHALRVPRAHRAAG